MEQKTIQVKKPSQENMTLEEFEKKHSQTFLYFLEEYEKWQELKKKA